MEKVLGIGGLFVRAKDPSSLAAWYTKHLGIPPIPMSYGQQPWHQSEGATAFAPFPESTDCFGNTGKSWMVNFRVQNLEAMVASSGSPAHSLASIIPRAKSRSRRDEPAERFSRVSSISCCTFPRRSASAYGISGWNITIE